jgi:cardiolipin synthase
MIVRTPADPQVSSRVFTLPNALSLLRLLGVPLFLWLILGPEEDLLAVAVLMFSGFSDWLDGRLARAWGQVSRVGQLLDPLADRLYIVATVSAFLIRDIIPWWLAAILLGRDLVLAFTLPVLRHYGYGPLPVHFLGKAATFNLLSAFPLVLLSQVDGASVVAPFGWAFMVWGVTLYCWAGLLYLAQVARLVQAERREVTR